MQGPCKRSLGRLGAQASFVVKNALDAKSNTVLNLLLVIMEY